jgi:hypothetical protein
MEMRHLIVLILIGFNFACSTGEIHIGEGEEQESPNIVAETSDEPPSAEEPAKKASWKSSYIGDKGYLNRPPMFETAADKDKFLRCVPFTVKNFESRDGKMVMTVEQGGNKIKIVGANRKQFKLNGKLRIGELDQFFVKKLSWSKETRSTASQSRACSGQLVQSMTEKEFLFVAGSPEKINTYTKDRQKVQEWVYVSKDNSAPPMNYYFSRGRMYAWKKP